MSRLQTEFTLTLHTLTVSFGAMFINPATMTYLIAFDRLLAMTRFTEKLTLLQFSFQSCPTIAFSDTDANEERPATWNYVIKLQVFGCIASDAMTAEQFFSPDASTCHPSCFIVGHIIMVSGTLPLSYVRTGDQERKNREPNG